MGGGGERGLILWVGIENGIEFGPNQKKRWENGERLPVGPCYLSAPVGSGRRYLSGLGGLSERGGKRGVVAGMIFEEETS